jgi:hypothetical protein
MKKSKIILQIGNLMSGKRIFGLMLFKISISNPFPDFLKAVISYRGVGRMKFLYIFGIRFVWVTTFKKPVKKNGKGRKLNIWWE